MHNSGDLCRENADVYLGVIASEAKQSIFSHGIAMDCFASLAMTAHLKSWLFEKSIRGDASHANGVVPRTRTHTPRLLVMRSGERPSSSASLVSALTEGVNQFAKSDRSRSMGPGAPCAIAH
jgi:hypothetical protein